MTRSHVVVLLLMVCLGRGFAAHAANGSGEPTVTERTAARATVAKWLEALRRKDAGGLAMLSARPFVLDGFDMVTGPERRACAALATSESEQHTLRFTATEDSAVTATMACLIHDKSFISPLPAGDIASWPERIPSGRNSGKVAKLTTIATKQMPRPLRKYAQEIKQLSPEGFIVYLFATDNNGISVDAAFVVSPGHEGRVRAVFVNTRFEE
jgi:hypothetical protein